MPKRVFLAKDVPFGGLLNIGLHLGGQTLKSRPKGVVKGLSDLLLELWDRLHISGTGGAKNFKFGTNTAHSKPLTKMQN